MTNREYRNKQGHRARPKPVWLKKDELKAYSSLSVFDVLKSHNVNADTEDINYDNPTSDWADLSPKAAAIISLTGCKYLLPDITFCNQPREYQRPYCAEHNKLCYYSALEDKSAEPPQLTP